MAGLLCGCNSQTKLNIEKTTELSKKLVALQEIQSKQIATLQSQLTSLAPMLDKMNAANFEKTHEDAIFFHTNTLYLILLVDNKIESELREADTERKAEHALAYSYHTNQMNALQLAYTQINDAISAQGTRIETNAITLNLETKQAIATLGAELLKQIKASAPDAAEIASRTQMEADVVQIKSELEVIKAQLARTNIPALGP